MRRFPLSFIVWIAGLWLAGLLLAGAGAVLAQTGPQRTERIEAELVAMTRWVAPGSTVVVAVRQKIQPGWHTYWRNPGDSGGATTLAWRPAPGVSFGEIVWPLPERQPVQGLMNYGYSGEVWLPVPVEVPATARSEGTLPLRVSALFLVCSDELCVPEPLELALDLPVRSGEPPLNGRDGAAIRRVLETAPRPAAIQATAALAGGVLTLTATGGPLAGVDLSGAHFFPYQPNIIDHAAAQSGESGPRGLTLRLAPARRLAGAGLTDPVQGVLATDVGAFEIMARPGPALAGARGSGALTGRVPGVEAPGWTGVIQAAGLALLGGLLLNLMPCVFPILAMKAAALASVGGDSGAARRDGLGFLAGVVVTFLALAGVLLVLRAGGEAVGWGFQLQSPPVVAALALLMLASALNLSGVFHVGAGLQGLASGPLAKLPGWAGAVFTGVLAVVVAAPCTAPFMAPALGAALLMSWPIALLVFLALAIGFALPFVLASFSPGLITRLPRPGPWMVHLRSLLALPMYGAALWLGWVFWRQGGDLALVLLSAAAIMLAAALWLAGLGQVARAQGRGGVVALTVALVSIVVCGGLVVAADRAARLDGPPGQTPAGDGPVSQPWSPSAVQSAVAQGRPVLVNFTADWCVTCKINERTSLGSPAVAEALARSGAVYLVADWTRRDAAIAAELTRHGRSGVPLYLLYTPGQARPRVLPQLLTEGLVVEALGSAGRTR